MNYAAALILIIGSLSIKSFAQASPPPPPPPSIYKAPEKAELKEFTADDKSFRITFPGVPTLESKDLPYAKVRIYKTTREASKSIVTIVDYDREVANDKGEFYELVRKSYLVVPGSKIEAETDIKVDGISGKNFDVNLYYEFEKVRILIVGKRVFEIKTHVDNWHILTDYHKEIIKDFNQETERFFSAFSLIEKPK